MSQPIDIEAVILCTGYAIYILGFLTFIVIDVINAPVHPTDEELEK